MTSSSFRSASDGIPSEHPGPIGTGDSVLIVGSGIIGIACAHYLRKAGLRVTVIDRGFVAAACSHANCGFLCASHVLPLTEPGAIGLALRSMLNPRAPFRVKPRMSPALWQWMWQFARRCRQRPMLVAGRHLQTILDSSMAEYRRLMNEESLVCEWMEDGLLYVLQTDRGMRQFADTNDLLTKHFGVTARRIDGADLPEFDAALKPGLAGAFHYAGDASVRPDRLNSSWSRRLRDAGVRFIEQCELKGIEKSAGRVTGMRTTQGPIRADGYVIATGAWSSNISKDLECHIPIQPGKGYSVTMSRPDPCPQHPILFPEHKVGVSPFQGGFRLGSMMEFAGYDTSIPKQRIQQLRDAAKSYLIASVDGPAEETWYGWRPMTWDSLPIIGRAPKLKNVWLATGHNMVGVTLAPATGRLIAELMIGKPTHIDVAPYNVERF